METRDLASDAKQLAEEIRRMQLYVADARHREVLKHAEALARSLADELEDSARKWPDDGAVASQRSY